MELCVGWSSIASFGLTGEKPASISVPLNENSLKLLPKVVVENDGILTVDT